MWLALMIGNSRSHWGLFDNETLTKTWDTNHVNPSAIQNLATQTLQQLLTNLFPPPSPHPPLRVHHSPQRGEPAHGGGFTIPSSSPLPLSLASVVPQQTALWKSYPNVRIITLDEIPIQKLYPTLGIDRALALLGAGETWGFPMLVIDAGTALTFTGADGNRCLVGGAILPGLGLQLATLAQKTGQLPNVELPQQLPLRYASDTQAAMQSGVIYTMLAGIKDFVSAWWRDFPDGKVVITGGDRTLLSNYLQLQYPDIASRIVVEQNLIFWGMQKVKK